MPEIFILIPPLMLVVAAYTHWTMHNPQPFPPYRACTYTAADSQKPAV